MKQRDNTFGNAMVIEEHICGTNDQYLAAVAEFDILWETDTTGHAKARMEELLAIIALFEGCCRRTDLSVASNGTLKKGRSL